MKNAIIVLFTILFSFSIKAQSIQLKRANKYFERTFYAEAILLYEKIVSEEKSYVAIKNLADSYFFLNKKKQAGKYYKYLLKNYAEIVNESYYLKYANTLKAQGKNNTANNILKKYYIINNPKKLIHLEKEIEYLEDVAAIGDRFTIKNVGINTSESEFGAIQKGDTIIFAAPRKETEAFKKRFGWNNQHYLDLYKVSKKSLHLGDSLAIAFSEKINSKLHESNIIFTKDGKTAYFTRNNLVKGKRKSDAKKVTHVQLYKAQFINNEWTNITSLPFNSNEYSTEHPALSIDEKILYFASDMPKGFGSFDLYKVQINSDGSFEAPVNLGSKINTLNREQFPFISKKNQLFFSSDGHANFGSLDVFVSTITNNEFSKPDNIGFPINSGYDDFSFNINTETKEGYFASNRGGGKGGDDIYQIVEQKPLELKKCSQFISGFVTDIDSKITLNNTLVILENNQGKEISRSSTQSNNKFNFTVPCKATYIVKASKNGYSNSQRTIIIQKERNKDNDASLALKSLAAIEKEKKEALALKIANEQELKTKNETKLKLQKKEKITQIIANEKDIEKKGNKIIVKTDEINFDYKLWYLRRDSKKVIDKVIALMKKYPEMIIEVGTHSDSRGNNNYNLNLSQKRATSVRMYFLENDIEPDRITGIGYGENKPFITCKTNDACSE